MEERTIKAICIDNKTEEHKNYKGIPVKENLKGLTKDKEYEVKQSKEYEDYFEVMNDLGKIETYKKYRFEVVEGEKVEEVIKVRCIKKCKEDLDALSVGAEYTVLEESIDCYLISNEKDINNTWYSKELFEKVTDDVFMVECVDDKEFEGHLTKGEKYKVIKDSGVNLKIKNDKGSVQFYRKTRFKPVEPPKEEKKEYTVMELLDFEVGTKFKDEDGYLVEVMNLENETNEKGLVFSNDDNEGMLTISSIWKRMRFKKVEEPKPVLFIEAWKALEEGKEIESVYTFDRYKKENGLLLLAHKGESYYKCNHIYASELKKANLLVDEYKMIAAQNKEQIVNILIQQHNFIHGEYNLVCKDNRALRNALNKAVEKEG